MKKVICLFLAAVLAVTAFSACGSGNSGTNGGSGGASSSGAASSDSSGSASEEKTESKTEDSKTEESQTTDSQTSESQASDDGASGKWPSYLNLKNNFEDYLPIVKEGEGSDIVVTVAIAQPGNGSDWDDLWIGKFIERFMNINFKVEQILDSAMAERKNLMMAAGDLPDLMLNFWFSTAEIVKYGVMDGQFLDLKPYLDYELTPFIMDDFTNMPDALALSTAPDGKVYTLPLLQNPDDPAFGVRIFIDQRWLDACGLSNPRTLDEFIDMLRVFKEADVNNVGAGNVVPMACAFNFMNIEYYLLNALGYLIRADNRGFDPAVRKGEAELPANNPEIYGEMLRTMKLMFDEGLIYQNYFTAPNDGTEVNALLLDNRTGVFPNPVYVTGYEEWKDWVGMHPLTSAFNDEPKWPLPPGINVGNFVLSANCRYPELIMRFGNTYFSPDGLGSMLWEGPVNGSEWAMGVPGVRWNFKTDDYEWVEEEYPEGVVDLWTYLMVVQGPMPAWGSYDMLDKWYTYREKIVGGPPQPKGYTFNLENADQQYRKTLWENSCPYYVSGFPAITYLDEDTVLRMDDYRAVLKPYINEQLALFVMGRRPMDEVDGFVSELRGMGIDDLEKIYKEIWANYLRASQ